MVRSARVFTGGMTLSAWAAPTTISIYTWLEKGRVLVDRVQYLDRAVINQETIELLEGLTSAVRLEEGHVGDAAALRVGTIRNFDLLDGSHRLNEVFLSGK